MEVAVLTMEVVSPIYFAIDTKFSLEYVCVVVPVAVELATTLLVAAAIMCRIWYNAGADISLAVSGCMHRCRNVSETYAVCQNATISKRSSGTCAEGPNQHQLAYLSVSWQLSLQPCGSGHSCSPMSRKFVLDGNRAEGL